jgi:hypothetical protein
MNGGRRGKTAIGCSRDQINVVSELIENVYHLWDTMALSSGGIDMRRIAPLVIALCLTMSLLACGGGGGSTTAPMPTPNASPGGIWMGTESVSGLSDEGIVDEAGQFHFIRSDGVQYVGTATTTGNSISANFDGYAPINTAFGDGSTHGTGTLSGTIVARTSISVTIQFETDAGTSSSQTLALTFSSLYDVASSLATISGNYTDPSTGDVISVSSGGDVSWQDAASGCVGNGTVSIINASYNAYGVQFTYSNCTGAAAALNGVQFTGLGTLDNAVSPEQFLVGVNGAAGATTYAAVLGLNRN